MGIIKGKRNLDQNQFWRGKGPIKADSRSWSEADDKAEQRLLPLSIPRSIEDPFPPMPSDTEKNSYFSHSASSLPFRSVIQTTR